MSAIRKERRSHHDRWRRAVKTLYRKGMSAGAIHEWLIEKGEHVTLPLIQKYWKEVDDFYHKKNEPRKRSAPIKKKRELNVAETRECILELKDLIREHGFQQGTKVFRARHSHYLGKDEINKVINTLKHFDQQANKRKARDKKQRRKRGKRERIRRQIEITRKEKGH